MFERTTLWPLSRPTIDCQLSVGDGHILHVEARGRATGKPVVCLHGGPGRGWAESTRGFFAPHVWRDIYPDQRGCGDSTPLGCLTNNTTGHLVEDLERVREFLGIDEWSVFGAGWGAFLGLWYASQYPDRVHSMILVDIILFRQLEIDWLFRYGASEHYPEAWDIFLSPLPPSERAEPLGAYYRIFTEGTDAEVQTAVRAWSQWESVTSGNLNIAADPANYQLAKTLAQIECHYFYHRGFTTVDGEILQRLQALRDRKILGIIVHGGANMVNPARHARDLHRAWPEAEFVEVPGAGHSLSDLGIRKALLKASRTLGGCGCLIPFLGEQPRERERLGGAERKDGEA